jgi:rhamnosyltransferase subunit B
MSLPGSDSPRRDAPIARPRRIVLTTVGSLGDLHPYLAIALRLRERGHQPIMATSACYRDKIEALGLTFHPVRPDADKIADPEAMRRFMDPRRGTWRIIRELIVPALRDSYEDIRTAAADADLLVSHPLTAFATRLVAEKTGTPWASTMITPLGFFSAYDLPAVMLAPVLMERLRFLGPRFWGPALRLLKRLSRFPAAPWYRLREELGLPPAPEINPLIDSHSPSLVLALFSGRLAAPQPDWPRQTVLTGFPVFDRDVSGPSPPEVIDFLTSGPPPIVFTLGISSAMVAGQFFEESVQVAQRLGRRALLVTGKNPANRLGPLAAGMMACDYAPFSEIFSRAAVIVHHGGIGTTGLAMRSGRPALVVYCSHDQPDNAARIARLGLGRALAQGAYRAARVEGELRHLLDDPGYTTRAEEVGRQVRQEDGAGRACEAIEAICGGSASA